MDIVLSERIAGAIRRFCAWLDRYGETSYDHQSFFASKPGRGAKALYYRRPLVGTLAVSPIIFCEAFLPAARKLFWKPQRFPIADAHYAMGFAFLAEGERENAYYRRAVHFLEVLQQTRCRGYDDYCWGYPFSWETRNGVIREGTPLITTLPYIYEAFSQIYAIDREQKWLEVLRSIARHAFSSYLEVKTGPDSSSCGYTPAEDDPAGVVNASAYRAFLLTKAGLELSEPKYLQAARRNVNFVISAQNADGSWCYSTDGERNFVDHFHTCFVLKALVKIGRLVALPECERAVERGIRYYVGNLVDKDGLPIPFSKRPRLTVYRRELYDYAESINLGVLLGGRYPEMDRVLSNVVADVLERWQKPDGSFRSRQLLAGWDNMPMHRWAQSQMFRSLSFLLHQQLPEANAAATRFGSRIVAV